jgi:ubiquinone biosynthesis UbiH/UbiF/VisC/COQ6 family hydroxylase
MPSFPAPPIAAAQPTTAVAVLGAGLVAQTCCLALAQSGIGRVLWLPQAVPPQPTPATVVPGPADTPEADYDARVFALNGASRRLLRKLRVWDALERLQPVAQMRVADAAGTRPLVFDALRHAAAGDEALAWIVEARVLRRALEQALAFQPAIERLDVGIAAIDPFDAQGARLQRADGGTLAVDLALLAELPPALALGDAWLGFAEHDYGCRALVGTVACARAHAGIAHQWFERDVPAVPGVLALLPLPAADGSGGGNFVSIVWSTPRAEQLAALDDAALGAALERASGGALGALRPLGARVLWPLKRRAAARWFDGALLAVGDAVHGVHPLAGQGLNLGLQDAEALAATLAAREPFRALADARLLRRFVRARARQVTQMVQLTDGVWRSHALGSPPWTWLGGGEAPAAGAAGATASAGSAAPWRRLAGLALALVERSDPLKRWLAAQAHGPRADAVARRAP